MWILLALYQLLQEHKRYSMATQSLVAKIQTYFPDFKIVEKSSSTLMKIIGILMFFAPGFMTQFLTTLGDTVYVPSLSWAESNLPCLIHETVHMYDNKRLGILYQLGYIFPQILSLLTIPLFFSFIGI